MNRKIMENFAEWQSFSAYYYDIIYTGGDYSENKERNI